MQVRKAMAQEKIGKITCSSKTVWTLVTVKTGQSFHIATKSTIHSSVSREVGQVRVILSY